MTAIKIETFTSGTLQQIVLHCADLPWGVACTINHLEATDRWTCRYAQRDFGDARYAIYASESEAIRAARAWVRRRARQATTQQVAA